MSNAPFDEGSVVEGGLPDGWRVAGGKRIFQGTVKRFSVPGTPLRLHMGKRTFSAIANRGHHERGDSAGGTKPCDPEAARRRNPPGKRGYSDTGSGGSKVQRCRT